MPEPTFFETPLAWRDWLAAHHESETEFWVGFHKKATGRPSITWPESVEQALCFGWIDGIRRSVNDASYMIRFTPRRERSTWSEVNLATYADLEQRGLVTEAGRAVYARRRENRPGPPPEELRDASLTPEQERRFRANEAAWEDFQSRPSGYRRMAIRWVVSAKRQETRERRLSQVIADCAAHTTIPPLTR